MINNQRIIQTAELLFFCYSHDIDKFKQTYSIIIKGKIEKSGIADHIWGEKCEHYILGCEIKTINMKYKIH